LAVLRPRRGAGKPGLARDGKPNTAWATTDAEAEANVWFDLGEKRPVIVVRWFQARTGGGDELQLSTDRKHWKTVGRGGDVASGTWQTLAVEETARYVRFRYVGTDGPTRLGFLAEVEVYGPKVAAGDTQERLTTPPVGDVVGEADQAGQTDAKEANSKGAKKRAHDRPVGRETNSHRKATTGPRTHIHPEPGRTATAGAVGTGTPRMIPTATRSPPTRVRNRGRRIHRPPRRLGLKNRKLSADEVH